LTREKRRSKSDCGARSNNKKYKKRIEGKRSELGGSTLAALGELEGVLSSIGAGAGLAAGECRRFGDLLAVPLRQTALAALSELPGMGPTLRAAAGRRLHRIPGGVLEGADLPGRAAGLSSGQGVQALRALVLAVLVQPGVVAGGAALADLLVLHDGGA
jgi:hypothetical protein